MRGVTAQGANGKTSPGKGGSVDRETAFDILSNQRRRHTLHYLLREERPVELRELSTQISAWENGVEPEEISHKERKRVYTALRQTHLPKMDEEGVLNYDKNRGVIEPTTEVEDLEFYLDVVPEKEISRGEYYLGLSLVSAGLVVAVYLDAVPFNALPDLAWIGIIVAAFLISATVDTFFERRRQLGREGPPPDINAD